MATLLKPWSMLLPPSAGVGVLVPTIDVLLTTRRGPIREVTFLIDSGADISLAPRTLCDELGSDWQLGEPIQLHGISPKPECAVEARVLDVELLLPELAIAMTIPICFADGDASLLLGREGFFECFRIEFDLPRRLTKLELLDE